MDARCRKCARPAAAMVWLFGCATLLLTGCYRGYVVDAAALRKLDGYHGRGTVVLADAPERVVFRGSSRVTVPVDGVDRDIRVRGAWYDAGRDRLLVDSTRHGRVEVPLDAGPVKVETRNRAAFVWSILGPSMLVTTVGAVVGLMAYATAYARGLGSVH